MSQADGGVIKKILKAGSGWEKPEKGDQVFGKLIRYQPRLNHHRSEHFCIAPPLYG